MYALSVKQPYASLIAVGEKTIEWRSRVWHYRGPVVICASKSPKVEIPGSTHYLTTGAAVCLVDMVDCRYFTEKDLKPSCNESFGLYNIKGRDGYAWVLENPREIEPIPVKGIVAPWPWKGPELTLAPGWHEHINFVGKAIKYLRNYRS